MNQGYDVVILSAFGRGHWLASQLARSGVSVALVDLNGCFGPWSPEDWEGPFGYFRHPKVSSSQIERLSSDDYSDLVESGFSLLLPHGPINFQDSLTQFVLDKNRIPQLVRDHMAKSFSTDPFDCTELLNLPFQRSWMGHLAHSIASTEYRSNAQSMEFGSPLPLFSQYWVRRASRRGYEKSLAWLEQTGVKVFRKAKLVDLVREKKTLTSIEVESSESRALNAKTFVSTLTSYESEYLGADFNQALNGGVINKPQWGWMRFRVAIDNSLVAHTLPVKFWIVFDLFTPWTHGNLLGLQKAETKDQLDVWLKIPEFQRFNRKYVNDIIDETLGRLSERLAGTDFQLFSAPQELNYDEDRLGPPCFPIYQENALQKKINSTGNVYHLSPEQWKRLDWTGQLFSAEILIDKLLRRLTKSEEKMESEL